MADSGTKLTNADTVAIVNVCAIATNTPVITFVTRLLMFTGCYSQENVPEMLQSADISCPLTMQVSPKCNARLYTEVSCICRRKWKCRCLGIPFIHNN
jgi:hypothetical protein